MVIQDKELNLSLEEFQLFQECPQKFRLYRILNPVPNKETFLKKKRPIQEYRLRNYSEEEMKGIKYHHFFSTFHPNYEYSIKKNSIEPKLLADPIHSLFWKYQLQRYKENIGKYPWQPLVTEFNIMIESQRGIIDSIDFINNDEELRLIDYKTEKQKGDLEALYFYAILLDDFMEEKNWDGLEISEVGCYYYINGELSVVDYKYKMKEKLLEKILSTLEKIKEENFELKSNSCYKCDLKIICGIVKGRN